MHPASRKSPTAAAARTPVDVRTVRDGEALPKQPASAVSPAFGFDEGLDGWESPPLFFDPDALGQPWLTPERLASLAAVARERMAAGEPALPYVTVDATGGLGAEEGGRPFGVEVEFELEGEKPERELALAKIGRELHEAGLIPKPRLTLAHASEYYPTTHTRGWRFEKDWTVSGAEVVSPVMRDTPETWEKLVTVLDAIRRHGGVANTAAGAHVHVGVGDFGEDVLAHQKVIELLSAFQEELYLLATNPARGEHRGTKHCAPNLLPSEGYASLRELRGENAKKSLGLNFRNTKATPSSHLEYRLWDASLDPAVMQAQVKLSLALTALARRMTEGMWPPLPIQPPEEPVLRLQMLLDALFTREEDKLQAAMLYAVNASTKAAKER